MSFHIDKILNAIATPEGLDSLATEFSQQDFPPLTSESLAQLAAELPQKLAQQQQQQEAPAKAQVQPGLPVQPIPQGGQTNA